MSFDEKVEHRYRLERGRDYHESKRTIPECAYPWVASLRARKMQPEVADGDVVLEYGVGTGWNLARLRCGRRLGFDLAEHVQSVLGQHGIEFIADTAALAEGTVDVCVCHHTLEHTPQPPGVIAEIARLLRSGGKLLLFVPYERERRYRRYDAGEPNHHLYSWNVQTLGNLTADAGFHILQAGIGRFGYDRFAAVWAARTGLGEWGYRWIRRAVHLVQPAYEVRIVARKESSCEDVRAALCRIQRSAATGPP
jgi:SAM-dependent methyltransferase